MASVDLAGILLLSYDEIGQIFAKGQPLDETMPRMPG